MLRTFLGDMPPGGENANVRTVAADGVDSAISEGEVLIRHFTLNHLGPG